MCAALFGYQSSLTETKRHTFKNILNKTGGIENIRISYKTRKRFFL